MCIQCWKWIRIQLWRQKVMWRHGGWILAEEHLVHLCQFLCYFTVSDTFFSSSLVKIHRCLQRKFSKEECSGMHYGLPKKHSCTEGTADLHGRTFGCAIIDTYTVFSNTWTSLAHCFILRADEGNEPSKPALWVEGIWWNFVFLKFSFPVEI